MVAKNDMEGPAPTSDDLNQVLEQFLAGRIHVELLLATVSSVLEDDLNSAHELQEKLDDALRAGTLPEQVWERITAEIDQAISEDEPTEWSEDSPATPPQLRGLVDASGAFQTPAIPLPVNSPPPVLDDPVAAAPPKAPAGPMEPGKLLGDRYVIVSRVKTGGMGDIYKALDRRKKEASEPDPWVAIKVLGDEFAEHPEAMATLEREAAHSRKLEHPNVIRVFDIDHSGERSFITMEWLDGESLVDIMDQARSQPLPEAQARQLIQDIGAALSHAHDRGVVHADVKPGNVFVDRYGSGKLLDFGVARAAAEIHDVPELNALTPAYCSCEVLEGLPATPADDLFSFALLTYRALAGKRAFGRITAIEAEAEGTEAERLGCLNDNEWAALKSALAFRREQRPADIASFLKLFQEPCAEQPDAAPASLEENVAAEPVNTPAIESVTSPTELPDLTPAAAAEASEELAVAETGADPQHSGRFRKAAAWITPLLLIGAGAAFWLRSPDSPAPAIEPPTAAAPAENQSAPLAAAAPVLESEVNELAPEPEFLPEPAPAVTTEETQAREAIRLNPDQDEPAAALASSSGDITEPAITDAAAQPPVASVDEDLVIDPGSAEPEPTSRLAANTADPAEAPDSSPGLITQAQSLPSSGPQTNDPRVPATTATDIDSDSGPGPAGEVADTSLVTAENSTRIAALDEPAPVELPVVPMGPPVPPPVATKPPMEFGPAPAPEPTGPREVAMSELVFERFIEPRFPRRTRARRASGWVQVDFLVQENGETADVRVRESEPEEIFDQAAIDAVKKWVFKPRVIEGVPEAVLTTVRLRFEPQQR